MFKTPTPRVVEDAMTENTDKTSTKLPTPVAPARRIDPSPAIASTPGRVIVHAMGAVVVLFSALVSPSLSAQTRPCLTIACPRDVAVECAGHSGTTVTFQPPIVESNCGTAPQVTCTPASGSVFPPGTNTVNCVATDALRN